jgi:hypothetical protein
MITQSERTDYVAAHIRPSARLALRTESQRTEESMSKIISDAVEKELETRGYDLDSDLVQMIGEVPLPFEANP